VNRFTIHDFGNARVRRSCFTAGFAYRIVGVALGALALTTRAQADERLPRMAELKVVSSIDGTAQPCLLWAPDSATQKPTPVLIWLHSWSFDYRQKDARAYHAEAVKRGWILLLPNFRGKNNNPGAGGSKQARGDILDALNYAQEHFKVDPSRIYLAGGSGGGHMALLMAAYHQERFSAISAWVPITNLADWYQLHSQPGGAERYAKNVLAVCGGPPGASAIVDAEYQARSPIYHLDNVKGLHLDIAAGIHDTAVPITHSLQAYNRIAVKQGRSPISESEIEQLLKREQLDVPQESNRAADPSYGCAILLRRTAGDARISIFDGGHVAIPAACCVWLAKQQRATTR
jgi:dipeptidyl aminopeptidase/acylaminoacyl peptidase